MTADFGYNWAPSTDVTGNTNSGAIGDRVWIDADGDGVQDPGGVGLSGVTVALWYDSDGDGVIDVLYPTNGTKTTNATGNYVFDELPAGIYEVRITAGTSGYTQTGDPDHYGRRARRAQSHDIPVILGPGDVFVNVDFGYKPVDGTSGTIGDRSGSISIETAHRMRGENRHPGRDRGPGQGPQRQRGLGCGGPDHRHRHHRCQRSVRFPRPADDEWRWHDDYLVWVNDTDNVLGTMDPTFDRDGLGNPASGVVSGSDIAAVTDLVPGITSDVDFGYTADGHNGLRGLIGDTIFIDRDGGNDLDAGEAVEGVTVELWNSTGTIKLATTTTDENGNYYFGNLYPNLTYQVRVPTSNFATGAVLEGMANVVDPDAELPTSPRCR